MYRRLPGSLPQDPVWPKTFKTLGYKVNEKSQIRAIVNPDLTFKFFITNNERYNDLNREAMHTCIGEEINKRMAKLDMPALYLPQMTIEKPVTNHVPIYANSKDRLKSKSRVIVVVNGQNQEFGCWSFRTIFGEPGIEGGSSVSLAREILGKDDAGLIILNPSQLIYSHSMNRSLSLSSWRDRHRKSAAHPQHGIDDVQNRVPGNESPRNHIRYVFEKVLSNPEFVNPEAKIDVIGLLDGANDMLEFLNTNWATYSGRISAIALVNPWHNPDDIDSVPFTKFLEDRGRIWTLSGAPVNTTLAMPSQPERPGVHRQRVSSPTLSGGVADFPECIFPDSYKLILGWLDEVAKDADGYKNPPLEVSNWEEEVLAPPGAATSQNEQTSDDDVTDGKNGVEDVNIAGLDVPKSLAERSGLL